jgi:hypothetical protein
MSYVSDKTHQEGLGNRCPNKDCQSEDIEGTDFNSDGEIVSQSMYCKECDSEWEDIYKLAGFSLV